MATPPQGGQVRAQELFAHYVAWATQQGQREAEHLNATGFGRRIARQFPKSRSKAGVMYQRLTLRRCDG